MKKHKFLAPLAISISALLGGMTVPAAQASKVSPVTQPMSVVPQESHHFVLTRSGGSNLLLTQHESHASHDSHESHSSHMSGS
jgi:hypothetical protein